MTPYSRRPESSTCPAGTVDLHHFTAWDDCEAGPEGLTELYRVPAHGIHFRSMPGVRRSQKAAHRSRAALVEVVDLYFSVRCRPRRWFVVRISGELQDQGIRLPYPPGGIGVRQEDEFGFRQVLLLPPGALARHVMLAGNRVDHEGRLRRPDVKASRRTPGSGRDRRATGGRRAEPNVVARSGEGQDRSSDPGRVPGFLNAALPGPRRPEGPSPGVPATRSRDSRTALAITDGPGGEQYPGGIADPQGLRFPRLAGSFLCSVVSPCAFMVR